MATVRPRTGPVGYLLSTSWYGIVAVVRSDAVTLTLAWGSRRRVLDLQKRGAEVDDIADGWRSVTVFVPPTQVASAVTATAVLRSSTGAEATVVATA
ncbi:hypothetical protein [Nakamurella endophytica]|uniref:hypothetical protein n=1 Tax=Nakamurella endophytica TaxID=1748367 RepID=UPI0016661871|nr:hypothetical protein [Nakamurella endophytica]